MNYAMVFWTYAALFPVEGVVGDPLLNRGFAAAEEVGRGLISRQQSQRLTPVEIRLALAVGCRNAICSKYYVHSVEACDQRVTELNYWTIAIDERNRLESNAEHWNALLLSLRELIEWVIRKDTELTGLGPIGGDSPSLQKQQDDHRAFRRQLEDKRPVVESNLLSGRQYIANEPPLSDTSDTEDISCFCYYCQKFCQIDKTPLQDTLQGILPNPNYLRHCLSRVATSDETLKD
ncbi:hypothetical protein LSTR_LSTR014094 [Laodelphax striatellus]|uniref:Uncharacterized protein n=1 Tax=Laodelphax striatellus TaxID=195883 RepID=A0A482WTF0_LAOST|nr:hypothetical protein LSTR_LSTR014094 [Laodelphax striatellus]